MNFRVFFQVTMLPLFLICMQRLAARTSLREPNVIAPGIAAFEESTKPPFILLTFMLSIVVILLGVSIVDVLLDHVHKAADTHAAESRGKKKPPTDLEGKEMWSDDDEDETSTVADASEASFDLTVAILSHPPPGWRPPLSSINSF